ncbi:GNAT family N-acetyltransferase [Robertmurraya sp. P23]|uniref:GNAT family N-acetyltransferase n=1 Tax=Robertmurraya sp. P23 TaxID=3436931 RepID=UPI003D98B975
MKIKFAEESDVQIILDLMHKAFQEYRNALPPSSALDETEESILIDMSSGGKSLICYLNDQPVGMVRYQVKENSLYFYRLSVIPEMRGTGIAKKLISSLEDIGTQERLTTIFCKVRATVPKNISLYRSIGYTIFDEEIVHRPNSSPILTYSMLKKLN